MLWKCYTQYANKFEKLSSVHRTGKGQFHSSHNEGQCQRMFKLPHNCTYLTHYQSHDQISPSEASTVRGLRTSRCTIWIWKRQRNQRPNCQHLLNHRKCKRIPENIYFCFTDYAKAFEYVDHNKLWKILTEMRTPDHLTWGQEAIVRTRHGPMDWFKIGKEVCQGCILSSCLFNLYAEYIMQNARLDKAQPGIMIAGRNINNLRYTDDITLMAETKRN